MSNPTGNLEPHGISAEGLQYLQSCGFTPEKLRQLAEVLHEKLKDVPVLLFQGGKAPTLGDVLSQGHKLIPTIPIEFGFPWLLQNVSEIRKYNNEAWKHHQPEPMAKAIYHWRLDKNHIFHRWHSMSRWNIAIFMALIVKKEQFGLAGDAITFMKCYLKAVLESHNEPAQFQHRDAFISNWRSHRYDFFTPRGRIENGIKDRMRALTQEWFVLLDQQRQQLGTPEYERRYGKFIGTLVPDHQATGIVGIQRDRNNILPSKLAARLSQLSLPDDGYRMTVLQILDAPDTMSSGQLPQKLNSRFACNIIEAADALDTVPAGDILQMLLNRFATD